MIQFLVAYSLERESGENRWSTLEYCMKSDSMCMPLLESVSIVFGAVAFIILQKPSHVCLMSHCAADIG